MGTKNVPTLPGWRNNSHATVRQRIDPTRQRFADLIGKTLNNPCKESYVCRIEAVKQKDTHLVFQIWVQQPKTKWVSFCSGVLADFFGIDRKRVLV